MAASRDQRNSAGRGSGGRERTFSLTKVGDTMKKVLPPKTRISKEVKEMVEQCSTEFIVFITSEAVKNNKDFTLTGDGIISALAHLGFDDYVEPLQIYLQKYMKPFEAAYKAMAGTSTSAVTEGRRSETRDGDYPNGILRVGTAEDFQDLTALILVNIY
ncbi:nuclear transcription factor Y subunit B-1-like [Neltuma alba]|uniref:nuclear transcription factor Y subunit B-1-like n=1 Tax=Neltuma alba TaxID=207710 RepID=UPI0010A33A8F|nr:nuclear transcription factor Y subunit B-1-like [Prosopis alba]